MKRLSWAELSLFLNDRKAWERRYVQGIKDPPSKAMLRGKDIHETCFGVLPCAFDPVRYFPKDIRIHRKIYDEYRRIVKGKHEHEKRVEAEILEVPTLAYWDGYDSLEKEILELKTGSRLWTEKEVSEHGQLHLYALQHLSLYGSLPKVFLVSASTSTGKVVAFELDPEVLKDKVANMALTVQEAWKELKNYDRLPS